MTIQNVEFLVYPKREFMDERDIALFAQELQRMARVGFHNNDIQVSFLFDRNTLTRAQFLEKHGFDPKHYVWVGETPNSKMKPPRSSLDIDVDYARYPTDGITH